MLNNAPYDGPYNHYCGDIAANGWASDERFLDASGDGSGWNGNFSGIDYMLLYNLYYICSGMYNNNHAILSGTYPKEVDSSYSDMWNDITTVYYPLGCTFTPYNELSCAPITVTSFTVLAGDSVGYGASTWESNGGPPPQPPLPSQNEWVIGDVAAQTSSANYIDINPSSGNVIVQNGAVFTASCTLDCCEPPINTYTYESDPGTTYDRAPEKRIDSINYQMSSEFAPKPNYDAIIVYPNPFISQTTLEFAVKETTPVTISIYDTKGQEVTNVFINQMYNQGNYVQIFNGSSLAAGTYLCIMTTKDDKKTVEIIKD